MTKKHTVFSINRKQHGKCMICETTNPNRFFSESDNCCKKCAKTVLSPENFHDLEQDNPSTLYGLREPS